MTANPVRALATRQAAPVAMRTDNMDTLTVAKMLAESGFFGEVRDAGKALAKILAGQELGMGPIASLMGVYYQQGKVTYSANIMAAAVKKTGQYTYRVKTIDHAECSIEFFERQGAAMVSLGVSDFNIQDAETAGLTTGPNKHNWKNYPRNMLFARAMSNGVKWFTPDIFGGITPYTPDELGGEVIIGDDGEMRPKIDEVTTAPAPTPVTGEVIDANASAWTEGSEQRWEAGAAKAQQIGAAIPEKPPETATYQEIVAGLKSLGTKIKARQELLDTLTEVVGIANETSPEPFLIPENIAAFPDDEVSRLIAAAQQSIEQIAVPA